MLAGYGELQTRDTNLANQTGQGVSKLVAADAIQWLGERQRETPLFTGRFFANDVSNVRPETALSVRHCSRRRHREGGQFRWDHRYVGTLDHLVDMIVYEVGHPQCSLDQFQQDHGIKRFTKMERGSKFVRAANDTGRLSR